MPSGFMIEPPDYHLEDDESEECSSAALDDGSGGLSEVWPVLRF